MTDRQRNGQNYDSNNVCLTMCIKNDRIATVVNLVTIYIQHSFCADMKLN